MTAHILIVEDDRVTRMRLAGSLRKQGYLVTEVEDADAMQQVIDTDRPDQAFRAFVVLCTRRDLPDQRGAEMMALDLGVKSGIPAGRERPDIEDRRDGFTPVPEKLPRMIAFPAHGPACPSSRSAAR